MELKAGHINERKIRPWNQKPKDFNAGRISNNNNPFYKSNEWRTARAFQLRNCPNCIECHKRGRYTMATVVDHIIPINEGGHKTNPDNLQSLCDTCHNRKSGLESAAKKKERKGIFSKEKEEEIDYFKKWVTDRK